MKQTKKVVKAGLLKPFLPFSELPPEYVIVTANFAEEIVVETGEILIEKSSEDNNDYFLVSGELELEDIYNQISTLESKTPHARKPLPQLRPSAYTIRALSQATVIRIPQEVIKRVCSEAPDKDLNVDEEALLDITQTREFFEDFKEELHQHRVRLPSLRSSAKRIHKVVGLDEDITTAQLLEVVSQDPGIAAKLLKMSNSSLFNSAGPVCDLPGAVERLGLYASKEITSCFAFRDVFKNMPAEINAILEAQVEESRQVSLMATVIAEMSEKIDPQVAALAGLLHNIGVLPIFGYATRNVAYAMNVSLVEHAITRLSQEVGVLIAKKWRLGKDITESLEQGSNWLYDPGTEPDLVSVVLTAKYHHALSKHGVKLLPKPKEVPSLSVISKGDFNETFSLRILDRAKMLGADSLAI